MKREGKRGGERWADGGMMAPCSSSTLCHIASGGGTSEWYSIVSAVLGNHKNTPLHTDATRQRQAGPAELIGLSTAARPPRTPAQARIMLDSIIKCHVITRYGAALSRASSPPGCWDRYGEVCVCTSVSACLLSLTCLRLAEGLMEAGGDRGGRCGVGMDGAERRNWR